MSRLGDIISTVLVTLGVAGFVGILAYHDTLSRHGSEDFAWIISGGLAISAGVLALCAIDGWKNRSD